MFGYIVAKEFVESSVWDYASVVIFEETGFYLKRHQGKVFNKDLLEALEQIERGDQVEFDIKTMARGRFTFTEFVMVKPVVFTECPECGKVAHKGECTGNGDKDSELLEGEFSIIQITPYDSYDKIVVRGPHAQFTFILWPNSDFKQKICLGDRVNVCGWRTPNRITKLRTCTLI